MIMKETARTEAAEPIEAGNPFTALAKAPAKGSAERIRITNWGFEHICDYIG